MNLSDHANVRAQQRAIPELWLELLSIYGDASLQKGGCEHVVLPKHAQRQLLRDLKRVLRQFDHLSNVAMITSGEEVVTSFHKH